MANWELKNDLYAILRHDQSGTVDLLRRYSYPDVGRERRRAFIGELLELLEYRRNMLPHFNYMMLKGVLEIAKNLSSLPYLEDETPNVLIDGFGMFFIHRICLFKNCEHILDVEEVVQSYISGETFTDGERTLANYRFAVSDDEPGIQISDVITGMLGRLFSFIQESELSDLVQSRESLNPQQERNLGLLRQLLDRSLEENSAFAHYVLSFEDRQRAAFCLSAEAICRRTATGGGRPRLDSEFRSPSYCGVANGSSSDQVSTVSTCRTGPSRRRPGRIEAFRTVSCHALIILRASLA